MIVDDPTLSEMPKQLVESLQCNAEWALKLQMDALIDQFERIEDGYLRDRKTDVVQVVERILKVLMGRPGQVLARSTPEENSIQDLQDALDDLNDVGFAVPQIAVLDAFELVDQRIHLQFERPLGVALQGFDQLFRHLRKRRIVDNHQMHVEEGLELGRRPSGNVLP